MSTAEVLKIQKLHERTGRPLGSDRFLKKMEVTMGRILRPQKPGPKKKKIYFLRNSLNELLKNGKQGAIGFKDRGKKDLEGKTSNFDLI